LVDMNRLEIVDHGNRDGTHPETGSHVVTVSGEVDTVTAPRLRQALEDALDSGPPAVMVDLAGVSFMDASGIGVLVSVAQQADSMNRKLTLGAPSQAVLRVLEAAGLDGVLHIDT
jgi:anti-sigma B factor antagonist